MTINKLSKKQKQIFGFINSNKSMLICDGAVRSGKTMCMSVAFIIWAMEYFDHMNFGICGKTVQSATRNVLNPLREIDDINNAYTLTFKQSKSLLIVKCGKKINYFYFFGGKDESSAALIQGITLAGVLFDEVALMPRSFVEQATARTLSISNSKLWFNCNPDKPSHWFYKTWIEKKHKTVKHLHFLMSDNPILTDEQLEKASNSFDGVFHQRFIQGLWVAAEGAIYKVFNQNKSNFLIDEIQQTQFSHICIGVDFGGDKSAHAFVAIAHNLEYDILYVLKSERVIATGTTALDINQSFEKFIAYVNEKWGQVDKIYCDNAEQVLINSMKEYAPQHSFTNARKYEPIQRIRATTTLMATERIKIIANENQALINAFENAIFDEKSLKDKRLDNGTSDVDTLDAFEYAWEKMIRKFIRRF